MGASPGNGGFQRHVQPQRGQDYEQPVEITLQEAFQGTTRLLHKEGQRLEVKIPAGARTDTRVRMSGAGGMGNAGGPAGNIYLRVTVMPDPRFERRGDDLHTTVTVGLYTMVLGGEVRVPTMAGERVLTIPAGTKNGRTFRLRGQGMPRLRQPEMRGDLYVKAAVSLPARLTDRQKELFEELRQLDGSPQPT
jgi:curved DNA-binding protein